MKKVVLCVGLMVMMASGSYVFGGTAYSQWAGTLNGEWATAANWNTNLPAGSHIVPNATDSAGVIGNNDYKAGFKTPGNYPNLSATANLGTGLVTTDIIVAGGGSLATPGNFLVNGATINVSQYISLSAGAADFGLMTMTSGTVSTGVQISNSPFYVSQKGTSTLQMSGGKIYVGNYQTPATPLFTGNLAMTDVAVGSTTGIGTLYLDGGDIYANDLVRGNGTSTSTSLVITDGSLWLKTNRGSVTTGEIGGYVTAGWLKAGTGYTLQTSYDASTNLTRVFATPEPATVCLLGLGVMGLLRRNKK